MAATDVSGANIVHKVLDQDNYEFWSFRVKTYLLAKDLWSVVTNEAPKKEANEVEFNNWSKKNAEALHAIHICCGDDMFPIVNGLDKAKAAWDKLEDTFNSTIYLPDDMSSHNTIYNTYGDEESVPLTVEDLKREFPNKKVRERHVEVIRKYSHEFGGIRNAMFQYAVGKGYLDVVKIYLTDYPEVLKARSSHTGGTALHKAVARGKILVVKELMDLMSAEDLEVQALGDMTALHLAALTGNVQIAKYLVKKSSRLVTIKCRPYTLPLLLAFKNEKWDVAQYLYSVTPTQALTQEDNGREGAELISFSFYSKEFDIALKLIRQCPTLTFAKDYSGNSPLYTSATMCSSFLTGTRLTRWQTWIYHNKLVFIGLKPAASMEDSQGIQIMEPCFIGEDGPGTQIQPDASMVGENVEDGQGNQRNFIIHSVIGCFRGLSKNLLHLLGIESIHKKKLAHAQTLKMLNLMCKEIKHLSFKQIQEGVVLQAMLQAVEQGNDGFIRKMCEACPILREIVDGKEKSLLQFSIECRQEEVYCLLIGLMSDEARQLMTNEVDKLGNSLLHSTGSLSSTAIAQLNHIPGAALQLQTELQWFKEVESIVPPKVHEMVNKQDRMRPRELFTKNHKEMVKEGERQMKEISTSSTVVGALIVTMMFAAVFTVPGGTNGDTGIPMLLDKRLFKVFIVSDAISLFFSTTSIVIFLGILTSRFAEDDFHRSLPTKLVAGLSTLFFSIATMMVAFVSALIIMLHQITWIIILAIFLASIPITSFAWMQSHLLVEMVMSTFGSGRFPKKK